MTTPNQSRAETVARIIDPSSWRVLDGYLADVKRLKNAGYDPDNFKHQASLAKAQEIIDRLDLPPLNGEPVPMVLFCPKCGVQHIDEPELPYIGDRIIETGDEEAAACIREATWNNPPHRSHLCLSCGHIWRPADIATVGVQAVQTKGKADSPTAVPPLNGGGEEAVWKEPEDAPLNGAVIYGCEIRGYRYQPYKPAAGKRPNGAKGRWQKSNGYGGFENSDPPWRWTDLNPTIPTPPALATLNVQGGRPALEAKLTLIIAKQLGTMGMTTGLSAKLHGDLAAAIASALSPPVVGEGQ